MNATRLSRRTFLAGAGLAALALPARGLLALASTTPVTVRTLNGTLRGEQADGVNVFRGVPFAQPPVGALRFRPPVPPAHWTGERDATRFAASAMQAAEPGIEHSEDCLYLNVWAPRGKGPFPVFVWIHGGGFTGGHSFEPVYDGTLLAQAGIVCVTVAYRLGVFGFLDIEPLLGADYAGSANNGLRDLIASLQWVQQNIAAFGGDPSRVTVGGQSAGAKLTDILLGVPSAQPLFHQAISESGGAERVWNRAQSADVARGFAETWRSLTGQEPSSLLTAPASALIAPQVRFIQQWPRHFPLRAEIDGTLLPLRPVETIAGGGSRGKRLLIGNTREESSAFLGPHPAHDAGAADLGNLPVDRFAEVYRKYRDIYPQMNEEQLRIRAVTAEEYWIPTVRVADACLQGGGSAWMYRVDFPEGAGLLRGFAHHSIDIRLFWDRPSPTDENAAAEAALALQMHHAWLAFLRGEVPVLEGIGPWPAYRAETRPTLVFDSNIHVEQAPQEKELRLWDGVL